MPANALVGGRPKVVSMIARPGAAAAVQIDDASENSQDESEASAQEGTRVTADDVCNSPATAGGSRNKRNPTEASEHDESSAEDTSVQVESDNEDAKRCKKGSPQRRKRDSADESDKQEEGSNDDSAAENGKRTDDDSDAEISGSDKKRAEHTKENERGTHKRGSSPEAGSADQDDSDVDDADATDTEKVNKTDASKTKKDDSSTTSTTKRQKVTPDTDDDDDDDDDVPEPSKASKAATAAATMCISGAIKVENDNGTFDIRVGESSIATIRSSVIKTQSAFEGLFVFAGGSCDTSTAEGKGMITIMCPDIAITASDVAIRAKCKCGKHGSITVKKTIFRVVKRSAGDGVDVVFRPTASAIVSDLQAHTEFEVTISRVPRLMKRRQKPIKDGLFGHFLPQSAERLVIVCNFFRDWYSELDAACSSKEVFKVSEFTTTAVTHSLMITSLFDLIVRSVRWDAQMRILMVAYILRCIAAVLKVSHDGSTASVRFPRAVAEARLQHMITMRHIASAFVKNMRSSDGAPAIVVRDMIQHALVALCYIHGKRVVPADILEGCPRVVKIVVEQFESKCKEKLRLLSDASAAVETDEYAHIAMQFLENPDLYSFQ